MDPNTTRPVGPGIGDLGPEISAVALKTIFVDDGTKPPRQEPLAEPNGSPQKHGGWVSTPVDPLLAPQGPDTSQKPVDPTILIGLWTGEDAQGGSLFENPTLKKGPEILPEGMGQAPQVLPDGGPEGISQEQKIKLKDFDSPEEKAKREKGTTPTNGKNYEIAVERSKDYKDKSIGEIVYDAIKNAVSGGGKKMVDPDQVQYADIDLDKMVDDLLGTGSHGIPGELGLDGALIGKMLGGDVTSIDKLGDFLKALDAFKGEGPFDDFAKEALGKLGLDDFAGAFKEAFPFLDLEALGFDAAIRAGETVVTPQADFSQLIDADRMSDYLLVA